jgi:photosystem II stability/assembly factor-like uncharacterized protein
MKNIVIIIINIIAICNILSSQEYRWIKLPVPDDTLFGTRMFLDIECADSLNCVAFIETHRNEDFQLMRTTDGGRTWKIILEQFDLPYENRGLAKIDYPSKELLIASCHEKYMYRSTNKGESWDTLLFEYIGNIAITNMYNNYFGIAYGADNINNFTKYIYYMTTDGGRTWKPDSTLFTRLPKGGMTRPKMLDTNLIVGINPWYGSFKTIWIEGDWNIYRIDTVYLPVDYKPIDVHFLNKKIGWICGGRKINNLDYSHLILKTEDGGKTWITKRDTFVNTYSLLDIEFLNDAFGMTCGGEDVFVTTDGGQNWTDMNIQTTVLYEHFHKLRIISETCAYVISFDGIYKYTNEVISVEDEMPKLFSISPNPAGEYIEISGMNKGLQPLVPEQEIKIFNLLGECVMSAGGAGGTHPLIPSQEGNVRIDVSGLPSGVYFVRVGGWVGRFVKI